MGFTGEGVGGAALLCFFLSEKDTFSKTLVSGVGRGVLSIPFVLLYCLLTILFCGVTNRGSITHQEREELKDGNVINLFLCRL